MPRQISRAESIRTDLRDSVSHALTLDDQLKPLIVHKPRQPSGVFHGKVDFSQPPWHLPVASAHLALHSLSRKLERDMRSDLDLPFRYRGGSDANTREALEAVVSLSEKADDFYVCLNTRELEKWSRTASVALELKEIPKRLPRPEGAPEARCPFCKNRTLRSMVLKGEIFCINPSCKDEEGRKPLARMVYSAVMGDWTILWQDNIIGMPA